MTDKKQLTTAHGNPIGDNQNSQTAGPRGPLLMQDYQLLEKMKFPFIKSSRIEESL